MSNTTNTPRRIGFIGLGIMGTPMAGHLIDAGHTLFVNTRGEVPQAIAGRAEACASAAEVARHADVIFIMVPDTPDVEKVLFGENGEQILAVEDAACRVNGGYVIEAEKTADGVRPAHIKDRIRALGPTVRPDLTLKPADPNAGNWVI